MLMRFERVTQIPDTLVPGMVYVTNDGPNHTAIMHFVNKDGTDIFPVGSSSSGNTGGHNLMATVQDITERDQLSPTANGLVMVADATADVNADASPAIYFFNITTGHYTVLNNTMSESDTHIPMDPNPDW